MTTTTLDTNPRINEAWLADTIDVTGQLPDVAVARLIERAIKLNASDLFLSGAPAGVVVQIRQNGILRPISVMPQELGKRAVGHVKAMSSMEYVDKRRPLDGRWIYHSVAGKAIDLRIGIIPTLYGEDVAIRLLSRDSGHFMLDRLGMAGAQLQTLHQLVENPSGLILITGPTGAGKTSTLYSALAYLNNGSRKINTIEDPIEFAFNGLHQSQVNPQIDLNYAELLRSVLRQNPDVIMIGEIRDEQTAQLAVHAAGTGILVFATLHSQGTSGAVQTMRSLGCHAHFLATALRCVLSQRLVRTLCAECRTEVSLEDAPLTFDEVRPWLRDGEGHTLYGKRGCPACGMTGYSGRTGVFELMQITPRLRKIIADARPISEIRDRAIEDRMMTFRQAALLKVARGETTTEEVLRVVPPEELMLDD